MKERKTEIEKRIEQVKKELTTIQDMRPGSLTEQSRGGKGVYCQLSYTHLNKGKTEYIRKACVPEVEKQLENYKKFKELTNEWVTLCIELSQIKMKLEKQKALE